MSIRTEVTELANELTDLGGVFLDATPNKEQAAAILEGLFGIVKEGLDFASIPQNERAKAIAHAFIIAGAAIADKAMKYPDDPA